MNTQELVDTIVGLIVEGSKELKIEKAEVLSLVMKECLMSEDVNPNHIYAPDLIKRCDKCLSEGFCDINSHLSVDTSDDPLY